MSKFLHLKKTHTLHFMHNVIRLLIYFKKGEKGIILQYLLTKVKWTLLNFTYLSASASLKKSSHDPMWDSENFLHSRSASY